MVGLDETYLKKWQEEDAEYLRYEYDLNREDVVFDIGSYRNEFADEIKRRYGCKVECFEALDNRAAWIFDGELEFGGAYYYSSQNVDTRPYKYKCYDIAKFLDNEVALIKINIEGDEYVLIDYIINTGLVKNIKNIQVQFHLVDGWDCEKKYKDLVSKLKLTHKLTWRFPFVWENWKRND